MGTDKKLHLKIRGKKLKNTERGIGLLNKSDPYYEIQGSNGRGTIYKSEIIKNNLNPIWNEVEIDIDELCDGDLDAIIKIVILDQDKDGESFDLMGTVDDISINKLLLKKFCHIPVTFNGKDSAGKIRIDAISIIEEENDEETEEAEDEEDNNNDDEKKAELSLKEKELRKLKRNVERLTNVIQDKQNSIESLKEESEEDKIEVDKLNDEVKEAKEKSKTMPCSGQLTLKIYGKDFENLDGFLRGGKSDPYYEVFGHNGQVIYKSEVQHDDLNPNFDMATIDICQLTNGNLNLPIRISFYDADGSDNKKNYMGSISTLSVNDIIEKSLLSEEDDSAGIDLIKGLDAVKKSKVYIEKDGTELIDYIDLKKLANDKKLLLEEIKQQYYDLCKEITDMENDLKEEKEKLTTAQEEVNSMALEIEELMSSLNINE